MNNTNGNFWTMSELTETVRTSLLPRLRAIAENGEEDELRSVLVFATHPSKAVLCSLPPRAGSDYEPDSVIDALNQARAVAILRTSVETISLTGTLAVGCAAPTRREAVVSSMEDAQGPFRVWYALIERGPNGELALGPWIDTGTDQPTRSAGFDA